MTKLEELKAAFEAATPGEWDYTVQADMLTSVYGNCQQDSMADADLIAFDIRNDDDAVFIALAHNLIPALLEAATELARFIDYLDTASGDGAYEHEIQRALAILEKLK